MTHSAFRSLVVDASGHVSTRTIQAVSASHARSLAAAEGHTVLECESEQASAGARLGRWIGAKAPNIDPLQFSQQMATMLQAGVTVKEAVSAMAQQGQDPARQQILAGLVVAMSHGSSLSDALRDSGAFPQLLVATVVASEQTGDLAVALDRYARHLERLAMVRDRVVGASAYPLLLLCVGSAVLLMLLAVVVPRFSRLLDVQGRELPLLSQALMSWGRFADANPAIPWVLAALLVAGAWWVATCIRNPQTRNRWLQAIPKVAVVAREFQHLQMYRTIAILTAGGIPALRSFELSRELLGPADRDKLDLALARIREGVSLSQALADCGLADAVVASMLAVAEKSGALAEVLDRIADGHDRSLQRSIDILTRLIEPVLMIVFGILIGGIVLLMYLPIFDLASTIS